MESTFFDTAVKGRSEWFGLVWFVEQKENGMLERTVLSFELLVLTVCTYYGKLANKYMKVLLQVIRCF